MPANIAVMSIIRNTANVIPINSAENLALSFTSSLNPIRRMPPYFMGPRLSVGPRSVGFLIERCSSHWHELLLPDVDIHQLARINRGVFFLEPENHRQHAQVDLFLAFIRQLDLGRDVRLHPDELQRYLDIRPDDLHLRVNVPMRWQTSDQDLRSAE